MTSRAAFTASALLQGMAVMAGSTTTQMTVHTTVVTGCTVSAAPVAFGNYMPGAGASASNAAIKVSCTNGTAFGVGLSAGSTSGASYAQRLLGDGTSTLQYNLYTSSAYAAVWGDGSGSTQIRTGNGAGIGTPVTLTVYGLLPDSAVNQAAAAGGYVDTIVVVLTY
jgi:spore coat protein U-like protein